MTKKEIEFQVILSKEENNYLKQELELCICIEHKKIKNSLNYIAKYKKNIKNYEKQIKDLKND